MELKAGQAGQAGQETLMLEADEKAKSRRTGKLVYKHASLAVER